MKELLKEWLKGYIVGTLFVTFCLFVYGQYMFRTEQKVLTIGFVDGDWKEVPAKQTPGAKKQ